MEEHFVRSKQSPTWLDLEGVGLPVKVDIHHCRGISSADRGQSLLPVRQVAVTKFAELFSPAT